jgi:hypothetical protein
MSESRLVSEKTEETVDGQDESSHFNNNSCCPSYGQGECLFFVRLIAYDTVTGCQGLYLWSSVFLFVVEFFNRLTFLNRIWLWRRLVLAERVDSMSTRQILPLESLTFRRESWCPFRTIDLSTEIERRPWKSSKPKFTRCERLNSTRSAPTLADP